MNRGTAIDLRSDTVTAPSDAMREAMASAKVGDDVLDGDPTTRRLEETVAELLGCEKALFFPSGTQANQVGIHLITEPGTELLVEQNAHVVHYELAGMAALSGVQIRPVPTEDGVLSVEAVSDHLRPASPYLPRISALEVENTHNAAGGRVTPWQQMKSLHQFAEERGLPVHLDGARLWNAAAALEVEPHELAECGTTVMVSFSKALGCPVGACLAGPADLIEEAWLIRKRWGGGMRQSGILTAACLWALEHNLERVGEDHDKASRLARELSEHPRIAPVEPDTNIVMLDLDGWSSADAAAQLERAGVLVVPFGPTRLRATTHLDVSESQVEEAAGIIAEVLA